MKIAFVGKGGSGKSTVSALFTRHLIDNNHHVLAVDADINQHFASLIGATFYPERALSRPHARRAIRTHLRGSNPLITNIEAFAKTTPPGAGSNLVSITGDDPLIKEHATQLAPNTYFMHVGTYDEEGIGTSCYHGNLAILENIISHTITGKRDWLVADMVAGTDAFAGALYVLFDAIFMVVEPTPESVGVFTQFKHLAEKAGMFDNVFVIGNKVQDEDDIAYIQQSVGDKLIATLPMHGGLRKSRQRGEQIAITDDDVARTLAHIESFAQAHRPNANDQLAKLHTLHRHFAKQPYTISKHGDINGQIDQSFRFSEQ
jgi:CO dehydrogenase maturation factor